MSTEPLRYPLHWPAGRPRTLGVDRKRAPFGRNGENGWKRELNLGTARERLERELKLLGVDEHILSTNLELRRDGHPRADRRVPEDSGVAVYFKLDGRDVAFACDRWDRIEDNIAAIAKHLESIRGQERWGVGSREQSFAGYSALPAPGQHSARTWRSVLNFGEGSTLKWDEVGERYRNLARLAIGDDAQLRELNVARDEARKEFGG
jgi:hypothetical protein